MVQPYIEIDPPSDIFRQNFYKKPRRIVAARSLTDTNFKIKREIKVGEAIDIISKQLDEQYRSFLKEELGIID